MKECPACSRCFPDQVNHCPSDGDLLKFTITGEPVLDGRYQLERRLGQGGMGVVFKARHIFLKTQHAIKIILPDLVGNDPSLSTRFRQEAMAAAAVHHQNTIRVTDFGIVNGTMPFLVMEFVEGPSLHDILQREKRLTPARALEIVLAVCAGVRAAHEFGIVHRDLKPLNIVLKSGQSASEGVKVLDFGLAKIKSGDLLGSFVAAQTQGMMGSPFYMAPEQWSDEEVDVRADIYSLGIILYQMLAGDVPFRGSSVPAIMKKHLIDPPSPLSERGVLVPPAVEAAVQHALEKEADRRPASVAEFMGELRAALDAINAEASSEFGARTMQFGQGEMLEQIRRQQSAMAEESVAPLVGTETVASWPVVDTGAVGEGSNANVSNPIIERQQSTSGMSDTAQQHANRTAVVQPDEASQRTRLAATSEASQTDEEEFARLRLEEQRRREEAAESARIEEEARLRAEAEKEEQRRAEIQEEERRRAEAEAAEAVRLRQVAAERERLEAEERERRAIEAKEQRDAAEHARLEAEARQKREAEEQARLAAEEQLKREALEKEKREAAEKQRRALEEQEQREAEEKRKREAEEEERKAAERKQAESARREALEQERRVALERERREAEERAQREAEEREKREAEELARREDEKRAAIAAAAQRKLEQAQQSAREEQIAKDASAKSSAQISKDSSAQVFQTPSVAAASSPPTRAPLIALGAVVVLALLASVGGFMAYRAGFFGSSNANVANNGNTGVETNTNAGAKLNDKPTQPDLVQLPGGAFTMGRNDVPPVSGQYAAAYLLWIYSQWPAHTVTVKPFAIDKTEVTNAEYAEFVKASNHAPPPDWDGDAPKAEEELWPVRSVSFDDAQAFAAWRSQRDVATYRLPTEEEWEYAARGGGSGEAARMFPWGGEWKDGLANLNSESPHPVGSFHAGATAQGVEDLIGNVSEWTSSPAAMYAGNNRTTLPDKDRGNVVVRGGSYRSKADGDKPFTATSRSWVARDVRDPTLGFRLVRAGEP